MNRKALSIGRRAVGSVIPCFVLLILWVWFWFFIVCLGSVGTETVPVWMNLVMFLPAFTSPGIGIYGVVYGFCHRSEEKAWLGILLSALGIAGNALLWFGVGWLGSQY